ncbi:MAG: membrane integrity-associated transporter subunit PqiC [Castellaniella sp.]|uniref:PqiC family protein n=1 Tax=Castellaniella sp. TaxID=1955812 RepID=UPI0012288BD9|nr:ABC-type transport auxiliary lipoprotein family protein [Castellaniella sp.]TAN27790.1 MAG: membrane integrity-associated transporter subunit PqiC [Castellaniella sp.]
MIRKAWVALSAVVMMAGCAGPSVHYYSLAPPAYRPAPEVAARQATYGLRLQVSEVPAEVDRLQLVVRDSPSAPSVQMLNQSLWAAPLRDQIQRGLSARVAEVLGVPDLDRVQGLASVPVRAVTVRVTRFDLLWGKRVVLEADWTDHGPGARAARLCRAGVSVPAGAGVAALVDGQRRALGVLARMIADQSSVSGSPADQGILYSGCTW